MKTQQADFVIVGGGTAGCVLAARLLVSSDDDIDTWLRKTAGFSHHLVGSCKMGNADDPLAVVGPDLRVHGLDRLRVIDASIMPTATTGNTHATTIAIAEKGADLIKASSSGQ